MKRQYGWCPLTSGGHWLFVAVVCGTAQWVNATVIFGRWGTDEGSVSWDQVTIVHTLALLNGHPAAWLLDGYKADTVCRAAGVGAAAVTVTLKAWKRKKGGGLIHFHFIYTAQNHNSSRLKLLYIVQ